jgi:hypothetical protein
MRPALQNGDNRQGHMNVTLKIYTLQNKSSFVNLLKTILMFRFGPRTDEEHVLQSWYKEKYTFMIRPIRFKNMIISILSIYSTFFQFEELKLQC